MSAKTWKITAIAALLGLGVAGAAATSASAYTVRTRCTGDDCVRLQCNDYGYDCFRIGYSDRDYDRSYYDREYYERPYGYTRTYQYYPDYAVPGYDRDYDEDYPD